MLLAKNGKRVPGALHRHSISEAAFERELRSHGVRRVEVSEEVRLEANGRVTLMKADQ